MRASRVVVGAVVGCLALAAAPSASAADDLMSGTFKLQGPNTVLDTWTITQLCNYIELGCQAKISSPLIEGQATYRGSHTWKMTLTGQVPVCADKSKTKGAMVFVWNSETLQGQLTEIQQGACQLTRPGQTIIPFTLVAA